MPTDLGLASIFGGVGQPIPLSSRGARLQVPLQAFHAVWYAEKLACYAERACRSLLAETINFTRDFVDAIHEELG